jgi:alkylation response protein AidB-like acyl-CoA dehydrogenase
MILSEDHEAIGEAVRRYVQQEVRPQAARGDREHLFPARQLAALAELGCLGVTVSEAWGGAGLDHLALIIEEIAAGDGATSTIVSVNSCPVCSIAACRTTT